jgi:hypothetical protein
MYLGNLHQISEWLLKNQPASHYREAAARARRLQSEATTASLKRYLSEMITRCEALAAETQPCGDL